MTPSAARGDRRESLASGHMFFTAGSTEAISAVRQPDVTAVWPLSVDVVNRGSVPCAS